MQLSPQRPGTGIKKGRSCWPGLLPASLVEFRGGTLNVLSWDRLVEVASFDPAYIHLHRTRYERDR